MFYKIMKYPVPKQVEYFSEGKKERKEKKADPISKQFSRTKKNPLMDAYLSEIQQLENIYKSIPFIEEIYLCNSISFNALHENSDIDLFIITRPERIRTAKFRATLFLLWKGKKRFLKKK